MALAKVTLIGMYNYDDTLFDQLTVPASIDKDVLIGNILMRSGDFESLYGSVPFVKDAIGLWSRKWAPTFERWAETWTMEYNPLENYDRNEEWTDKNTGTEKYEKDGSETHTGSGSENTVRSGSVSDVSDGGNTNVNEVSAYDAGNTLTTHDKQTFDTDQSNTTTYNDQTDTHTLNDLKDTLDFNNRVDTRRPDLTSTHKGRTHGNIGVTTSQQMMESEMNLRLQWNLYEKITDLFLVEFVLPVY